MNFKIAPKVFESLPDVCVAFVAAKGIDNTRVYPEIVELLNASITSATNTFKDKKVKEDARILPYREAFSSLGINPNRFPCSIESLFTRIAKGKGMPSISPIVDLGNAISLKYTLPIGAHSIGKTTEDIEVRFSSSNDYFLPFGETTPEEMEEGELVYAVGKEVRTRRWTWRQSEYGKITPETTDVFFPIDGFHSFNHEQVLLAQKELALLVQSIFQCQTTSGFVDCKNPVASISF